MKDLVLHQETAPYETDDLQQINRLQNESQTLEEENPAQALELRQKAIDLASKHSWERTFAEKLMENLHLHGLLCDKLANYGAALASYNQALELALTLKTPDKVAMEHNHIGVVFGRLGDHLTSVQHLLEAYKGYEDLGDVVHQTYILNNLGFTYVLINQNEKALYYLLKGLKLARESDNHYAVAITLDSLCHAYRGLKKYSQALECGLESVQICRDLGKQHEECEYCLSVGLVYHDNGDNINALHYFEQCLKIALRYGFRREESDALRRLGGIYFQQGHIQLALSSLSRALELALEIKAQHEIFKSHADLALLYKQIGNFEQALIHYEKFHETKEEVFNEQADVRLKSLETAHRLEQAQKEAEIYRLRNQALQSEIEERKVAQAQAEHIATIDPLTGLFNRRHYFHLAEAAFTRALYDTTSLCVLMFDIDHFKNVNDTYGHLIGDKVLIAAAQLIRNGLRTSDILGRYGGEEFAAILPETTLEQGHLVAERIRQSIESTPIETEKGPISITISGGVGLIFVDDSFSTLTLNVLIDRADQALYQAKQAGRNRTFVFEN
ncbi:MAG TPA: diguanylate cyclase [Anaerolineales bacterium]|nr:diguanylate cyclase [Anaerolineales bacterium]